MWPLWESKIMHACGPQAKGYVEQSNETLQDHNETYAVSPAKQGDIHKTVWTDDLGAAFCLKEDRVLTNDYIVTYKRRMFRLAAR